MFEFGGLVSADDNTRSIMWCQGSVRDEASQNNNDLTKSLNKWSDMTSAMMMANTVSSTPQPSTFNSPDKEDDFRSFSTQPPPKQQDEEMEFEAGELMDQPFSNTPAASNQQITAATAPTANILTWMMRQQDIVYWCLLQRCKDEWSTSCPQAVHKLVNHLLKKNYNFAWKSNVTQDMAGAVHNRKYCESHY